MIKLTEILKKIFINEYNKSQLDYIALKLNIPRTSDFESILGALDAKGIKYPELKDKILKGEIKTLEDLETLRGTPKRIKAGKINTGEADANLVYNQNQLRIYVGKTKKACIKYGNGYTFCISTRGKDSAYAEYRFDQGGTPYFVFDDTKSSEQDKDGEFIDPEHLLVVFRWIDPDTNDDYYSVTEADNPYDGETTFSDFSGLEKHYPRLKGLENIFQPVEDNSNSKEKDERALIKKYNKKLFSLKNERILQYGKDFAEEDYSSGITLRDISELSKNIEKIDDVLNNKSERYKITYTLKPTANIKNYQHFYTQKGYNQDKFTTYTNNPELDYEDFKIQFTKDYIGSGNPEDSIKDWNITSKKLQASNVYKSYLKEVKQLVNEYRNELTKLGI
jgi:hypothetical protein